MISKEQIKVSTGLSTTLQVVKSVIRAKEWDFHDTKDLYLPAFASWSASVQVSVAPATVNILCENTGSSTDIRFDHERLTGRYQDLLPGEFTYIPNTLLSGVSVAGRDAGDAFAKVTIVGNYA